MSSTAFDASLNAHYGRKDLMAVVNAGLAAAGKADGPLTPDDLASIDQFHSRGKDATLEMARRAEIGPGARVLDVGGGIGGAARWLAREHGCHVTAVDLTEEFCRVGAMLTARAGLADRVVFRHGNALALPFPDGSFDVVWTQHSTMNIADKPALYRELARMMAPAGRLAMHEILAGPTQPVHFPVPWARRPELSFLDTPEQFRARPAALGLVERAWHDSTDVSLEWFRARSTPAPASPPPPLGLHLILGADTRAMFANQLRNLQENRVRIAMGVWRR
ncbi:MAG: methyltransferase domain-containing protein [Candidatus Rokubacteria bacterium]|nr:methyltransferase domain-containing protein [Candidatus Rokubacteria bacterium]